MNSFTPVLTWPQTLKRLGLYLVIEFVLQITIVVLLSPHATATNSQDLKQLHETGGAAALIFFVVIIGPLIEELIFRLCLLNLVRVLATLALKPFTSLDRAQTVGTWIGITISAILFAAAHQETAFGIFLAHFAIGMFLGHLYRRSGKFSSAFLLHAGNNLLSSLALLA